MIPAAYAEPRIEWPAIALRIRFGEGRGAKTYVEPMDDVSGIWMRASSRPLDAVLFRVGRRLRGTVLTTASVEKVRKTFSLELRLAFPGQSFDVSALWPRR